MNTEKIVRMMAGTFVLTGTALTYFTGHMAWLLVPAFVGVNLLQSSFTAFCPAENIARALGARDGCGQGK
jgi:DUF2892 family protein